MGKGYNVDIVYVIFYGVKGVMYLGNSILNLDNIYLYVEGI